jgi:VWFA-related protein
MRAVWLSALSLIFLGAASAQQQPNVPNAPAPQAQNGTPSAPTPQPGADNLPNLKDQVTPGRGTGAADDQANPYGPPPSQTAPPPAQQGPPAGVTPPQIGGIPLYHVGVNEVYVPVTVRDKHGNLIGGLPWWRFRVYEDGVEQRIAYFTTDAYPLSIAFVIDETLPADIMARVNQSFSAVTGALTPSDSVAVISYAGTSPQLVTDFTGAEGERLPAALAMAKKPGQQPGVPIVDGPFALGPMVNGQQADPTLAPQPGNAGGFIVIPKEVHPLNDAILFAAEQLASQPKERRRIIYVISDGRNLRSKAKYNEVVQYLLRNNIAVYGTQVGESALWGIGYLDRLKLPLLQPDDVLPRYALATGGDVDHELSENGIQNAFVNIASEARTQYTIIYNSHQSTLSEKCHSIDVHVIGLSGLQVDAKQSYCPNASGSE